MKPEQINLSLDAVETIRSEIQQEVQNKFYRVILEDQLQKIEDLEIPELLDYTNEDGEIYPKETLEMRKVGLKKYIDALNIQIASLRAYAGMPSDEEIKEYEKNKNSTYNLDYWS